MATHQHLPERQLKKELGLLDVFAIALGAMVSSGFFLLPGIAMADTGPSLVLVYLVASLLILPAAASIAELATAMPVDGGAYYLLDRSMGRLTGTITGIGTWVQLILKSAFSLVGLGAYLTLVLDLPMQPVAISLAVVFMLVNLWGAHETGLVQRVLVLVIVVILGYFIVQGMIHLFFGTDVPEMESQFRPFLTDGWFGFLGMLGTIFVAYTGLTHVASVAEEIDRPERNIPLGMLLAWLAVTFIYVLGTWVIVGTLDRDELAGDETPVATAAAEFMEMLPHELGVWVIILAALAAFASTANAGLMSASRYGLAMGRDRVVPSRLAYIGRMGTPTYSIVLTAAVTILAIVVLDVRQIAKLASAFQLLIFALLCAAVIVMRRANQESYRPGFHSPLYPAAHLIGIAVYLTLIVLMGWLPVAICGAMIVAGTAWYAIYARGSLHRPAAIDDALEE